MAATRSGRLGRDYVGRHRAPRAALAVNTWTAANVANAWHAVDRGGKASVPSFVAGLVTSELPLPVLAGHVAGNLAALKGGAFRGRSGAAAAALAVGTAGGLIELERSARAAGGVYEDALRAALGRDYAERVVAPRHPGPDAVTAREPGLLRMARVRRRFVRDPDVSYGPARGANLLDIWRRQDLPEGALAPVLIQVPGGAWIYGNKQGQAYPLMSHLAEQGWVCVSINYRLGPRNVWPAQIVDVKRAIAWVRRNIAEYGGDPDFVAITGGSAGGHLSALAALTSGEKRWQPGFEDVDTSVAAAVPFYGAYDWTDRDRVGNPGLLRLLEDKVVKASLADDFADFDAASPMSHLHPDAPPFLISHGTQDSLIPVEEARLFARRLQAVSASPVVYAELPQAQHAFDVFGSARAKHAAVATGHFLGVAYGEYLRAYHPHHAR